MTLSMIAKPELPKPLKWHGGKDYLAARIVELMPPHTHYVEAFAGGLSVLLRKNPDGVSEVVNDLNGNLTHFWRVLQSENHFANTKRLLDATPFSSWEFMYAEHRQKTPLDYPIVVSDQQYARRAADFFVACRQSMAGRMNSFAPLSRTRTRRGMNEQASAWLGAIEGLPEVHSRLKRVVVLNDDAVKVIQQQDGPQTLFYLDPPYMHETRVSKGAYAHEMTVDQHVRLLETITGCAGKVMLSGYDCDLYRKYLDGKWARHEWDLPNHAAGGDTKRIMTEVLWCKF